MFCTRILFYVFLWSPLIDYSMAATTGCIFSDSPQNGLIAKFYSYVYADYNDIRSLDFMSYGFLNNQYLGQEKDITNVDINAGIKCDGKDSKSICSPYNGDNITYSVDDNNDTTFSCSGVYCGEVKPEFGTVYGFGVTTTNFTVELTGYLLASQSGTYRFEIDAIDDSAQLSIGSGVAFDCCQADGTAHNTAFTINGLNGWDGGLAAGKGNVTLQSGFYYPFQIVYVNAITFAHMEFQMTLPDGTVLNDLSGHVFSLPEDSSVQCIANFATTTTTHWTGTYTTTYFTTTFTSTGSDGHATIETTYYVKTPATSSSTDISSGTATSTTNYTPDSVTGTTTYSTATGTFTGPDGVITTETTYYVKTPTTSHPSTATATTNYTPGSVTSTTTYSTATGTFTGPDGIVTTETTYYVMTPTTSSSTATNKYSNGTTIRYETVFSTVYSYCSCSDVSIYSTDVVTVTTTNANGSPEKVIQTNHYVQVPETMTVNPNVGSAVAAALASKTTEVSIPKYSPITTGLSTYSGAASGLSTGVLTFAVGLLFAMVVV